MTKMKAAIIGLALFLSAGFAGFAAAEQGYLNTDLQFSLPVQGMSETQGMRGMRHGRRTAGETSDGQAASISQDTQAVTEVDNTVCPITGEAVGSMQKGAHVDHKGQRVSLCCPGCKAWFLTNGKANQKNYQDYAAHAQKAARKQ